MLVIGTKIGGAVGVGVALGLDGQTTKLFASVIPGQLAMSVAAAIGLNRGSSARGSTTP